MRMDDNSRRDSVAAECKRMEDDSINRNIRRRISKRPGPNADCRAFEEEEEAEEEEEEMCP